MRARFQPVLVIQTSSRAGHLAVRAALALWRAALISACIFFVLEGATYLAFQESPLAWFYKGAARCATGLEWIPYQVGKAIPLLRVPDDLAVLCYFRQPALPSVLLSLNASDYAPPPHAWIGDFYLEWPLFRQHMLSGTVTYFAIFMGLSWMRQAWFRRLQAPIGR